VWFTLTVRPLPLMNISLPVVRGGGRMGGDRDGQYPPRRDGYAADPGYRSAPPAPSPHERYAPREEYASDQVKDLLELYFRDPQAFDQYAKTYYYGERMERARALHDRRPPDAGYDSFLSVSASSSPLSLMYQ